MMAAVGAAVRPAAPRTRSCRSSASARPIRPPATYPPTGTRCPRAGNPQAAPATPARCESGSGSRRRHRACTSWPGGRRARPATPGRQERLANGPSGAGHVRGIPAGPAAAGDPARAAPARHHAGNSSWLDITIGGRVERHEGSWHRAGFDNQAITRGLLRSHQRHAVPCPGKSRYVPPARPVLKQALSAPRACDRSGLPVRMLWWQGCGQGFTCPWVHPGRRGNASRRS